MKEFYSVQEFAKLTGVEASTLRYWDDIGIFSPTKRDPENNYRYYSLPQILSVNFVSTLSDLNIPLKTIAELRKRRDPESFMTLLEKRERQLDMELRALRLRSSIIHARRELISYGLKVDETQILVMQRDKKAIILWPRNEYKEGDTFLEPLAAFVNQAEEQRVNLDFPVGGYFDSLESFQNAPNRPDHFFSADPVGTQARKEGEYLVGFARGYYGEVGDLPDRMITYAKENNLTVTGPLYLLYLHEETCTQEASNYLSQACIAISRKKLRSSR
jgi:DNA-binding transcriptional MerR regulator